MPLGHALHRYIPMLKGIVIWAFGVMLWSTPAFGDSGRPPWQKGSLIFEHKRNLSLFIQGYILSALYVVWHLCLCFAQHGGLQRYSITGMLRWIQARFQFSPFGVFSRGKDVD